MADPTAIKPVFFQNLPTFVAEQQAKETGTGDEEQHLHALSTHTGWKIIDQYARDLLKDMDEVTDLSMAQGLPLEEIGRNALVANLAKGVIKRILQKVDDAVEAVERANGTTNK